MGRKTNSRQPVLELLETRRLLAQISVTNFGAIPNNGGDDTAAIQAAVNASSPGDTIFFPSGTYNLSNEIFLKGNRTYQGTDGTVIDGSASYHIFHVQQDNTRIDSFTLNGWPIMLD